MRPIKKKVTAVDVKRPLGTDRPRLEPLFLGCTEVSYLELDLFVIQ